jgi:hypothetical protein
VSLPDLTTFTPHRTVVDAAFEGVPVPGLTAEFFRRPVGDRIATVGRYSRDGRELLMAWGYVDEEHCRHWAVPDPDGGWHPPAEGCPVVQVLRDQDDVIGLAIQEPGGTWVTA